MSSKTTLDGGWNAPGRMCKSIEYQVTCASCSNSYEIVNVYTTREAAAEFEDMGWRWKFGAWRCPECIEEGERGYLDDGGGE